MSGWRLEHPWALLIGGVLLLGILLMRHRRDERIAGGIAGSALVRSNWAGGLSFLAYVLAVLAWVNPQHGIEQTQETRHGVAILNVIDASSSMEALDFGLEKHSLTRFEGARQVLAQFVRARPHDLHGLVVFGETVFTVLPMTSDLQLMLQMIEQIQTRMAGQATAIGDAIALAVKRLVSVPAKSKVMIFLSDGANTAGELDPLEGIAYAKAQGIRIYSIGIGSGGRAPIQVDGFLGKQIQYVDMPMDEAMLKKIAFETGGLYFNAKNIEELKTVYAKIDQLEKSEFQSRISVFYQDHYFNFLRWSLLLAFAALIWQLLLLPRYPWL